MLQENARTPPAPSPKNNLLVINTVLVSDCGSCFPFCSCHPNPASLCRASLEEAAKWASDAPPLPTHDPPTSPGEAGELGGAGTAVAAPPADDSAMCDLVFMLFYSCVLQPEGASSPLPDSWCLNPPTIPTLVRPCLPWTPTGKPFFVLEGAIQTDIRSQRSYSWFQCWLNFCMLRSFNVGGLFRSE